MKTMRPHPTAIPIPGILLSALAGLFLVSPPAFAQATAADSATAMTTQASPPANFLQARGTKLYLNGREYRAIGVNMPFVSRVFTGQMDGQGMPDCHVQPPEDSVEKLKDAAANGFAFVRLFAYPNTPAEKRWYYENKEAYWQKMDEFMALCRELDLKLIPSLGMIPTHHQELAGEPLAAVLDPGSKTYQLMYEFAAEMVGRYKDDPNILMWEITNELVSKADVPRLGKVGEDDRLTFDQIVQHYRQITPFIKSIATNHLVTSGEGAPRAESMARRRGEKIHRETLDSLRDNLSNKLAAQPEPLDVFSIHGYGPDLNLPKEKTIGKAVDAEGYRLYPGRLRSADYNMALVKAGLLAGMPVLFGELGAAYPYYKDDSTAAWTRGMIDRMEAEGVSLIALWVWRFPEQPQYTFDAKSQPLLVERAREFNRKYGTFPASYKGE